MQGVIQLYLAQWASGQGCIGNKIVSSTWYVKNDKQRLYLMVRIPKTNFTPVSVGVNYFYPYPFMDYWRHSDTMGFGDGKPLDQYGWDEKNWHDDLSDRGRMDTRAKHSEADQYYWYEFSKPLDSGDDHDWSWTPGDKIGTDITGDLMIGSWGKLPAGRWRRCLCLPTIYNFRFDE